MLTFWNSPEWHAYEAAYGDVPGTRAALLAEATWSTRVLDLTADEATLWRGVRRSYHALIHRLEKAPGVRIVAVGREEFLRRCPTIHERAAGGRTRPVETWCHQADWIATGSGYAVVAYRASEPLAFAFAAAYGAWAYYFSSASLEPSVQHAVQWRMIRTLKSAGIRSYELGWQGEAHTDKERAIEFFKRGFGGRDVTVREVVAA